MPPLPACLTFRPASGLGRLATVGSSTVTAAYERDAGRRCRIVGRTSRFATVGPPARRLVFPTIPVPRPDKPRTRLLEVGDKDVGTGSALLRMHAQAAEWVAPQRARDDGRVNGVLTCPAAHGAMAAPQISFACDKPSRACATRQGTTPHRAARPPARSSSPAPASSTTGSGLPRRCQISGPVGPRRSGWHVSSLLRGPQHSLKLPHPGWWD